MIFAAAREMKELMEEVAESLYCAWEFDTRSKAETVEYTN